jgi:hypothetical protein
MLLHLPVDAARGQGDKDSPERRAFLSADPSCSSSMPPVPLKSGVSRITAG